MLGTISSDHHLKLLLNNGKYLNDPLPIYCIYLEIDVKYDRPLLNNEICIDTIDNNTLIICVVDNLSINNFGAVLITCLLIKKKTSYSEKN